MYARVHIETDVLEAQWGLPLAGGAGPLIPPPDEQGIAYYLLDEPINWRGKPSGTAVMLWNGGDYYWRETATLDDLRMEAIVAIDAAGETLRQAIISQPTQTEEYRRVEAQARAWAALGYPEGDGIDVPRGVTGWAQAKWREGWTNRQACDDILSTADVWLNVLDTIRDLRLMNKEDVRHAASVDEVRAITNDMRSDMRTIAAQLHITIDLEKA